MMRSKSVQPVRLFAAADRSAPTQDQHLSQWQRERMEAPLVDEPMPTLFGFDFPPICWGGVAAVLCGAAYWMTGS